MESFDQTRLVFSPLLDRFYRGQDWKTRPVKVSDSGRIRNELQTLASEALEYFGDNGIRIHFDRIDDAVLSPDKKQLIRRGPDLVQGAPPDLVQLARDGMRRQAETWR